MPIPSLVPSEYCLKCRGCCSFQEPASAWQPRLTVEEEIRLERDHPGCSASTQLKTCPGDGKHACVFLDVPTHHCNIYAQRPAECALYPFLLSPSEEGFRLFAHLACPFVQEQRHTPAWPELVERVKAYLVSPQAAGLLKAARAVYPDYSAFGPEIEDVGLVPFVDTGKELLARRSELETALAARRPVLSGRSFAGLYAWADFFDITVEDIQGCCCVIARRDGAAFLYFPPLGATILPGVVGEVFRLLGSGGAARIEGVSAEECAAFDAARYRVTRQSGEYVYDRAAVAGLSGKGYHSKRSDLNYFLSRHKPVFRAFLPSDTAACRDLFERWLDKRRGAYKDDVYRAMLAENRTVHHRLIAHAGELGLTGRVVEVEGRLAGYTFGHPLNEDTFAVSLEITEPGIKGLPVYIFRELCADAAVAPYPWINAMDDFGMPAVAAVKRSWRPVRMEPVYSISRT